MTYLFYGKTSSSWRIAVFGTYTLSAYCSVLAFGVFVYSVSAADINENEHIESESREQKSSPRSWTSGNRCDSTYSSSSGNSKNGGNSSNIPFGMIPLSCEEELTDITLTADSTHITNKINNEQSLNNKNNTKHTNNAKNRTLSEERDSAIDYVSYRKRRLPRFLGLSTLKYDLLCVIKAIQKDELLQLMIPYQICFGFSSGFVGYYINKNVVALYLGEGYIGVLTALCTLCAALLSYPFAAISKGGNAYIPLERGKWYIMICGALCFASSGFAPLFLSDKDLSQWQYIVFYYLLHGAARGCWENTNKAIIVEYFPDNEIRETAFATVYFTSGLSGATGYYFYKYMTRQQMVLLNCIMPLIALMCYHYSDKLYFTRKLRHELISSSSLDIDDAINSPGVEMQMSERSLI